MEFDFSEIMSNHTDIELVKIVTSDRHKYQENALLAAENELAKRNDIFADELVRLQTKVLHLPEYTKPQKKKAWYKKILSADASDANALPTLLAQLESRA